jgi:cap1 methyltransferase
MWRKKGFARGWGFTLVGQNDFQLNKFHPDAPTANFTPYYGVDKTGNIYLSENVRAFAAEVANATGNKGLALVTADGGFNVDGEENFQEVKVRQLVMCQFLTALTLLKQGGDFVCKLFDVFTPFTAELLYILYCHFDKFTLLKPFSSRPANSER